MRKGRFAGLNIAAPDSGSGRSRLIALALILGAPMLVAASALLVTQPHWIAATAASAALLAGWGWRLHSAAAEENDGIDRDRPERLLADFEASGCGWFWETNADGRLTYLSETLAQTLERNGGSLLGRRFDELLLVEQNDGTEQQRPTLGFHLSSRFPFADILVAPNGRSDVCWTLSGRPRFDEVGRFLGFHGLGLGLGEARRTEINSNQLAACDSLTGLPNRARMRAMLDEALANSDSRREGCGLFLIDLDRFKQVNDTLGHPVGDLLLKEVAQRLATALGGEGQVGRLGGDEFEAVLPGVDEEGRLASLAERLIAKVSAPYIVRGQTISIGASIGIAISRPGKTLADALVKEADLALYAAKKAGRGKCQFFEPHMHAEETERLILEHDLRSALARGQLSLLFQPLVDSSSEDPVGFEALMRWAHPVRGLLSPADFLPLAQSSGLMSTIGEWVVRTACAEAARWPRHLRLSVNLSSCELENPQLTGTIAHALAASGLEPERLELDLTESTLLCDSQSIRSTLESLRALGVRLCLDDFGSGPVSLLSLRATALGRLKIHPVLLREATDPASSARSVLAALVDLAEKLDMDVTAEGIETAEQLALVRTLGCDSIQGYLFDGPLSADQALSRAAASRPGAADEEFCARPPRQSLIRHGSLAWTGGNLPVRLRNISADGAMIESAQPLQPGVLVEIDLSGGVAVTGQVRWCQEGRIGVKFAEAFDLKRLGKPRRARGSTLLKPDYLESELAPDSPWAARQDRLSVKDVRRK